MPETLTTEIAIIGAGVIGLAIAEALLAEGRSVVLVDPGPPGGGASYGNAGTIADYAVLPVGTPDVLRNLPSLLLNRNSPLAIRHAALLSLAPWLLRFARQSLPGAAARNAGAVAALVADARPRWEALADRIGGSDLLRHRGCLYVYETMAGYRGAKGELAGKRSFGVTVEALTPAELAAMEPGLPAMPGGAAFFPDAVSMVDPGAMMHRLVAVVAKGAQIVTARAERISRDAGGVMVEGPGLRLRARRVVIAAGAHSKPLARMAGDRVPLDTERGYHLEWDMEVPLLQRPVCPTARGFYLCPMAGRLRAVGTVELGGFAPPSAHRLARLESGARALFPDLGPVARTWMGFRPSMPDSLPVIGLSAKGAEVIHAYGHGHIGLTLAPVTGAIVADLVAGRPPAVEMAPYRVGRF